MRCCWTHLRVGELACAATSFEFATVEQGRTIIGARDDYIQRLSPLERALKAKSEVPVSEADFLRLLTSAVQPWPDADRATVQAALDSIRPQLAVLNLPLPDTVVFVRFNGAVEGNAPHTRANAVLLSVESLQRPATLARLIAHELFHIASRWDRAWRGALYATIGFVAIDEVALPPSLALRKITNPDAPSIDVAVKVNTADGVAWVTPLLQSTVDRYDGVRGGEFFASMRLHWLEVARGELPPGGLRSATRLACTTPQTCADFTSKLVATLNTSFTRKNPCRKLRATSDRGNGPLARGPSTLA